MTAKQGARKSRGWTSKSINMDRVFFKLSAEAEEEVKKYAQGIDHTTDIEKINISPSDFPALQKDMNICREEIENGQGFVILETIEGLAYHGIQLYSWAISNMLGAPMVQNHLGNRLIHIYDRDATKQIKDGARYHQTHESGAVHTDNVNISELWEYLIVCCVQPAMIGGENIIACGLSAYEFLEEHAPEELAVLKKNFWWEFRGLSDKLYQAPVITMNERGEPMFRYLRTYLESAHVKADQPLTDTERRALDSLDAAINMSEFQIKYRLKEGQILVDYDSQIFHDRECFVDHQDYVSIDDKHKGKDGTLIRTLERTWVQK